MVKMSNLNDLLNSFTQGLGHISKQTYSEHAGLWQAAGKPALTSVCVCLSSLVLLCTHFSRANEKTQMDLICTGINSIKNYLDR